MRNVTSAVKRLDRVIDKIGDRLIIYPGLIRLLNKEFKTLSVKFKSKQHDFYSLSGYYAGKLREEDEARYNILITHEKWALADLKWMRNDILAVIIHELRHGYQDNARKDKPRKFQKITFTNMSKIDKVFANDKNKEFVYLTNSNELDAHAFEVGYFFNNNEQIKYRRSWIIDRYKEIVKPRSEKLYNRFLNKVYKFSQEQYA